jgi:hypothetical protein
MVNRFLLVKLPDICALKKPRNRTSHRNLLSVQRLGAYLAKAPGRAHSSAGGTLAGDNASDTMRRLAVAVGPHPDEIFWLPHKRNEAVESDYCLDLR